MLMSSDDGGVDHRVFVVRIVSQSLEKTFPNTALRPPREPRVSVLPVAEALGQIAPRRPRAEFPNHRLNEKPIAQRAIPSDMPHYPAANGQSAQTRRRAIRSAAPKASQKKAPDESRFTRFANSIIEDTPYAEASPLVSTCDGRPGWGGTGVGPSVRPAARDFWRQSTWSWDRARTFGLRWIRMARAGRFGMTLRMDA